MGGIGMKELLVILVVVLLVFGAKKLKNIGSDLGAAVKGFKKSMSDGDTEESVKQIKQDAADADFPDVAPDVVKRAEQKSERGA